LWFHLECSLNVPGVSNVHDVHAQHAATGSIIIK